MSEQGGVSRILTSGSPTTKMAGEAAAKMDVIELGRQGVKPQGFAKTYQGCRVKQTVGGPPHLWGVIHHPEGYGPYPARKLVLRQRKSRIGRAHV